MNSQNQHKGYHHKSSGHQKRKQHRKFRNKSFEKLGKDYGKQNKGGSVKLDSKKIEDNREFVDHAKDIAEKFKAGGKTQIRKFYDEFKTAIDSQNIFKLRMLLPKIHYQKSRKVLNVKWLNFLNS